MLRLTNISTQTRIAIACLLSLGAFTVFAGKVLLEQQSIYSATKEIAVIAEEAGAITNLIHEVQKERGPTVGFLVSKGQSSGDNVRNQRSAVDKALTEWQQHVVGLAQQHPGSKFARDVDAAKDKLGSLAATRASVDRLAIKPIEALDYYSAIVSLLATSIDEIGELTEEGRIVRQAAALGSHVRRKEWAGQERANGVMGFTEGHFTPASLYQFVRTRTIQDSQGAIFRRNAAQSQV